MKSIKKIGLCIFYLFLLIILIQNVNALGVAPAKEIVDFEPGLEGEVNLKIINSGQQDMKVFIYVEGELSQSIFLEENELIFSKEDDSKTVSYKYVLPEKFDIPGAHNTNIVIREVPVEKATQGTIIGASVSVVHQLRVNVPFPGKFAIAELKIAETGVDNQVDFIVTVNSLGTQKLINVKGIIDIFGPTNERIATVNTNLDSIDPGLRKDLRAIWKQDVINPGNYFAKLTLTYDGSVSESERIFQVGKLLVDILDINVQNFRLGEIAKFNILVENRWANLVKDAYVELIISEDGAEIGNFKSASEDIRGLSKEELTSFWDTAGVEEGEYGAKAILYYDDRSVEKDMKAIIGLNFIRFDLFGTGAVITDTEGINRNDIIAIVIVILVVINIGWFIYFRRRKK